MAAELVDHIKSIMCTIETAAAAAAGARAAAGIARAVWERSIFYTARWPAHFLKIFYFFLMPKVTISQRGVEVVLFFRPF